jgi:phosphatidylglycerophosphate synthase
MLARQFMMSTVQLHRTTGKPDWVAVPPQRRSIWQRLAVRTVGVLTPSNVVTAVGFALVLLGLQAILNQHYLRATILLAVGRFCDILDGWLAEVTGTKSPLGELLDAAVDKILTILTVAVFFAAHIAPVWVLVALVAPHVLIASIMLAWRLRNVAFHPSVYGKLSMAGVWISLVLYALHHVVPLPGPVLIGTQIIVIASSATGLYAATLYARGRD